MISSVISIIAINSGDTIKEDKNKNIVRRYKGLK
jgi:hypothetical protein